MSMYLHYEGSHGAAFTTKLSADALQLPLDEVLRAFVQEHQQAAPTSSSSAAAVTGNSNNKAALQVACLELQLHDGEQLRRMGSTLASCALDACGATDIFVVDCKPRKVTILPPPVPAVPSASSSAAMSSAPPAATAAASPSRNANGVTKQTIAHVIKAVKELFEDKAYKKARELLQEKMREVSLQGLEQLSAQGRRVTQDCSLHEALCEIFVKTEQYEKAVDSAERALECRVSVGPKNSSGSTQRYLNFLLATAHFYADNFEDAWAALQKTVDQCNMKKQMSTASTTGRVYEHFHLDVAALQAEVLFGLGKHQQAAEVVNNCMGDPQCEKHMSVLLAYSKFAAQYGKFEEAIRSLLKVVVVDQGDKRGRRLLARLVDTTSGIQELQTQLPPSEQSASAYAFLATICKDHSALGAARKMLEIALKHKPMNASYALNLLHVIELQGDGRYYQEALKVAEDFLLINKEFLKVGKKGFTAKQLWQAVQEAASEEGDVEGAVVGWLAEEAEVQGEAGVIEPSTQGGCAVTCALRRDISSAAATGPAYLLGPLDTAAADMFPAETDKEEYDPDSLDLLAISFALVKLLYLQGKLHKLAAVYRIVEPTRRRSLTPIHGTTIRNEHAYYQCIAQTLAYRLSCATADAATGADTAPLLPLSAVPELLRTQIEASAASKQAETAMKFPVSPILRNPRAACCDIYSHVDYKEAAKRPLYVVGDSHSVPLAWNVIRVVNKSTGRAELRLLVPKLVTGLKQYHLRKASDFYPKAQFAALLKGIPDGSDIIFVVGEIDCREGILVGVQRDSYDSVRQGMEATITHFAQTLPNLIKQRKMKVSIHPVLPMLNETRLMVSTFNEHYRRIMQTMIPAPGVRWLEFFDDLLVAEPPPSAGLQLRAGLRMDGTHITPAYVSLIESALHDTTVEELDLE